MQQAGAGTARQQYQASSLFFFLSLHTKPLLVVRVSLLVLIISYCSSNNFFSMPLSFAFHHFYGCTSCIASTTVLHWFCGVPVSCREKFDFLYSACTVGRELLALSFYFWDVFLLNLLFLISFLHLPEKLKCLLLMSLYRFSVEKTSQENVELGRLIKLLEHVTFTESRTLVCHEIT